MNQKFLLSICIPTYNREIYLKRLLDSIVSQKGFTDEISIVINDGPSKDNTREMVAEYQKQYKNVFYSRNDVAVGMLPAILESIDMSNGKYTWLFGSDDFMQEDALEITMDIIHTQDPILILSNRLTVQETEDAKSYDEKKQVIVPFHGFSELATYLGMDEPDKYQDKWNYLTFMSVFCFDTKHYRDMLKFVTEDICSIEDLRKHYFNYIVVIFSQLSSDKRICIIEKPRLVFCQGGNTSWEPNSKINQDIKMLMQYIQSQYTVSKKCIRMFRRMYVESYIYGNILYKLQKIGILRKCMELAMKNKITKSIYYSFTKMISGSN